MGYLEDGKGKKEGRNIVFDQSSDLLPLLTMRMVPGSWEVPLSKEEEWRRCVASR